MKKDDANKLIEQARKHYNNQLYNFAAKLYLEAYSICDAPFRLDDFSKMGDSYYEINDFASAATYYEKAIVMETRIGELLMLYAQVSDSYERAFDYQNAIDNFKKMVDIYADDKSICEQEREIGFESPFLGASYFKIATLYFKYGRKEDGLYYLGRSIDFGYKEAKEVYHEKTNQTYVSAKEQTQELIKKANKLFIEDNYEQADKVFKEAFIIIPDIFESFDLFAMGIASYYTSDYYMAETCLKATIVLEEDKNRQFYACFFLSHIYKQLSNNEKAYRYFAQPFALSKNYYDKSIAYHQHARVADTIGELDEAIESFKISITHFLQHLSHTEADVITGVVENEELGNIYFDVAITLCKFKDKDWDMIDKYKKMSALCGYKTGVILS